MKNAGADTALAFFLSGCNQSNLSTAAKVAKALNLTTYKMIFFTPFFLGFPKYGLQAGERCK
jgi:PBP1b-binding outer membrane lipoprotein LpoB